MTYEADSFEGSGTHDKINKVSGSLIVSLVGIALFSKAVYGFQMSQEAHSALFIVPFATFALGVYFWAMMRLSNSWK
jgi:hypothetical protein